MAIEVTPELQRFCDDVVRDLEEQRKLGIKIPDAAIEMAKDTEEMADYENMKVSECADLLVSLANIT